MGSRAFNCAQRVLTEVQPQALRLQAGAHPTHISGACTSCRCVIHTPLSRSWGLQILRSFSFASAASSVQVVWDRAAEFWITGTDLPTHADCAASCILHVLNVSLVQENRATDTSSSSSEKPPEATSANHSAGAQHEKQSTDRRETETDSSTSQKSQRSLKDVAQQTVKLSSEVAAEMARRLGMASSDGQSKATGTHNLLVFN